MSDERDRAGNPICGEDFMAGTICTLAPDHDGPHAPICQTCGGDWYLGTCTCGLRLVLAIENHYPEDGDVIHTTATVYVPEREPDEDESDWEYEHIFPATGTGRTEGDSAHFVTVTDADDPAWLGREFEFGT